MNSGPVDADIGVSADLHVLLIRPRDLQRTREIRGILCGAVPGLSLRRSAAGFMVSVPEGLRLRDAALPVKLRWSEQARLFLENRERVLAVHPALLQHLARIRTHGLAVAGEYLRDADGLDVLDDHQVVNVAAMTLPGGIGLCLFDEQGAGKTVSLIYAFDVLVHRDEADFALIVAPKSMVPEWPHDIRRFKGDLYNVSVASGSARKKRLSFRSGADIIVTNFETAVSLEADVQALLSRRRGRAVLVVDESYLIKNTDAQRTRALRRLREYCGRAFVLCGTPAPNSPSDLIEQFSLVDFGMTFPDTRATNDATALLPTVQAAVESKGLYIRHLKADVLPGLPAKRFQRVLLPLRPRQSTLYSQALIELRNDVTRADENVFRQQRLSFLARRSALLQICSNPCSLIPGYSEVPNKLLALDEILGELVAQKGEKVIVWSFFTASLEAILQRYRRFSPVRYDGAVNDTAERRSAVCKFQEDDETMLFVANPAAAGAGLTLHRARVAIFESLSNQAAHYLQALDRIHRRGQTRPVDYVMLLSDSTIEVGEYDRLLRKQDTARTLLGDPTESLVTRELFMKDLDAASRLFEDSQVAG